MSKDRPNTISKVIINPQEQHEMALRQLDQGNYKYAERWLRYAAVQGHTLSQQHLDMGIQLEYFPSTTNRLSTFAIDILEQLITPQPTEAQIQSLEKHLLFYLNLHYGLNSENYAKNIIKD